MRILIHASGYRVSNDMGGIGVRLWELSLAMVSLHIEVDIIAHGTSDLTAPAGIRIFDEMADVGSLIDSADAVIFTDLPDTVVMLEAYRRRKYIVVENQTPVEHLEYTQMRDRADRDQLYEEIVNAYKLQVILADHFIVRSSVERASIITSIVLAGRLTYENYTADRSLSHLITHVPIGYSRVSQQGAEVRRSTQLREDIDFLWNGGTWGFYVPEAVLEGVANLARRDRRVTLMFMYGLGAHEACVERAASMADQVRINTEPIPHTQRDEILLRAKTLITLASDGIENYICERLRLRDTFLYGLPIIVDSHGATGALVERHGIGLAVDTRKIDEVTDAMERLAFDEDLRHKMTQAIADVRHNFGLEYRILPLLTAIRTRQSSGASDSHSRDDAVAKLLSECPQLTARSPWIA